MSLRTKLVLLVDVLLRVPPLFVIDELFRIGLGLPQADPISKEYFTPTDNSTETFIDDGNEQLLQYNSLFYKFVFLVIVKFVLSCIGCVTSLCIFILWTKHLIVVYMYLFSVAVVFISYWGNMTAIRRVQDYGYGFLISDLFSLNIFESPCLQTLFSNHIGQLILSNIFLHTDLGLKNSTLQRVCSMSLMVPSLLVLLPLPRSLLLHAPAVAAILPFAMLKFILWINLIPVMEVLYSGYLQMRTFVSDIGFMALMETEWLRLNVPCVLRIFWVLRLVGHAGGLPLDDFSVPSLLHAAKYLLTSGCETVTAVLGMTSVISFICHYIGSFFQWVLLTEEEEDKSIGTVSAVLFYILALQTGLTGLEPEKRFIRLCRNFCLLFTALLHFTHNIVNPLLMSLSASHNPSLQRHLRALSVCAFLIIYPVSLLAYLWTHHQMSTWLLAVSAFSVEVIVKVIVSLLIYTLFLIDACRTTFWEKLDDYVYYIRAFGNTVEFCFGIFLFFNGAWILFFESGGAIRAGMMGIHAYFNIWCEARAGWSVFMKRRTAVNKIESLPEASGIQLANFDDVCAICYQEMLSAKITRCNHYFHGVCLRKWLYVQDRCPLCHDILYRVEAIENDKEGNQNSGEAGGNGAAHQPQAALLQPR